MAHVEGFDHIALAVPNLDEQVEHFVTVLGMVLQRRTEHSAFVADPVSGFRIELSETPEDDVQFLHLAFRTTNVAAAHAALVDAGMRSVQAPHRRGSAQVETAYLKEPNGLEVQVVNYS